MNLKVYKKKGTNTGILELQPGDDPNDYEVLLLKNVQFKSVEFAEGVDEGPRK